MRTTQFGWLLASLAVTACADSEGGMVEEFHGEVDVRELAVDRGRTFELHQNGIGDTSAVPYDVQAIVKVYYPEDDHGLAMFWFINYGSTQARIVWLGSMTCREEEQSLNVRGDLILDPGGDGGHTLGCHRVKQADLSFRLDN